jgi:hypothetical protein
MSFVDLFLPYFRQQLITNSLLDLLPFQPLFAESSCGDQLLAPPPSPVELTAPHPLCSVLVFSSLFLQFFAGVGEVGLGDVGGWEWCVSVCLE